MAKEDERRKKLAHLIKDLAQVEITKKNRVPVAIRDYILEEYDLHDSNVKHQLSDRGGTDFLLKLEDLIREKYRTTEKKKQIHSPKVNLKNSFVKSCDTFATANSEYLQTTLRMNSLLLKFLQLKEKYSQHLKEKSLVKKEKIEVLEKKLHFLKLQSFLKLYSENNAVDAHLKLRAILIERLEDLESQCNNLLDLSTKYNELKNNKTYMELFQIYKHLLKREMKLDYMTED